MLISSPIFRVGEKFLDWSDVDPSLDTILETVSLYWLTETFPRSVYPYRSVRPLRVGITSPDLLKSLEHTLRKVLCQETTWSLLVS